MNCELKLIITILSIYYIYYIVYNVDVNSLVNMECKKFIYNRHFMFISASVIIIGLMGWFNKTVCSVFGLISFLLPLTFILIDI